MLPPDLARQMPYAIFVVVLFSAYAILARRGTIKGRNLLWAGIAVAVIAIAVSLFHSMRALPPGTPLTLILINPIAMALVSIYCVTTAYRLQRVETLKTLTVGDTKVLVIVCQPSSIPDADALILPTNASLRMTSGISGMVGMTAGADVTKSLSKHAPVGIGKVVETPGGKLAVGHIYHVAVHSPLKDTAPATLRKGIETAAVQARKGEAESVAIPLGAMRGLSLAQSMETMIEGALKHRKAFGEIVFVTFDRRTGNTAEEIVTRIVNTLDNAQPQSAAQGK